MSRVSATIMHAGMGSVAGLLIGTVADAVFPTADTPLSANDSSGLAMLLVEIGAQLTVDALLTASYMAFLGSADVTDPAGGFAYMLCLGESQINLQRKIAKVSSFFNNKLSVLVGDVEAEVASLEGGPSVQGGKTIQPKSRAAMAKYTMH